ncbi:YybH family protein [Longimicrobium sp.]|uniref:YybH family protein n=1 Tax=Longimicrobium sp. TaxID=2029185 RepID=UPI003B3B1E45
MRSVLLLICLLASGGCAVSSQHEFDWRGGGNTEVAAIEAASREFSAAYVRGDVDSMLALYTPDAVIFPNNSEMITGADAIRGYWTLGAGQTVTHHRATPTEIRIDGNHAYDYGVYEISGTVNGTPYGPTHGKYVIVWRRTPAGWRMHLDMWNARPRP